MGYAQFVSQYSNPESGPSVSLDQGPSLDPRMSEIALRALSGSGLAMYLPFLLDSPARTSAWEPSKATRTLAYSVLQLVASTPITMISEIRRLQTISSGIQISVFPCSEIDRRSAVLLGLLTTVEANLKKPELAWLALSIYQDVVMTADQGKGQALSFALLRQLMTGNLNQQSWEFIHFLAQAQATHYSLRILHQAIEFAAHQSNRPLSSPLSQLNRSLTYLPQLAGFPFIRSFASQLSEFIREGNGLECLTILFTEHTDILSEIDEIQRPPAPKAKKSKKRKSSSSKSPASAVRPRPNNLFNALAGRGA